MTNKRESLSKKTRFEIFKRDMFTCQYCGNRPPDVVLVIDHINPVKEGGDNDEMNLVTSCVECNQGKGARKLEIVPNRPDADLEWLEMQQEIAELKRYQQAKAERDRIQAEIITQFQQKWWDLIDNEEAPSNNVFISVMTWADLPKIDQAIEIVSVKRDVIKSWNNRLKYFYGVLHNLVTEGDE